VINALMDAGLRLDRFTEHPDEFWEASPASRLRRSALPHTRAQMTKPSHDR
jgi:hypothetical protein